MLQISEKYKTSGARGVAAGALRRIASKIAPAVLPVRSSGPPADEFLTWVRFAVPGMLGKGNDSAIEYAITNMPKDLPILEIGSFCGLSTVVICYFLEQTGRSSKIFTCDKWEFEGQQLGSKLARSGHVTHDSYRTYVRDTFMRTMRTFAGDHLPHTIECFSDEFFRRWFGHEKATDVFDRDADLGGTIGFSYIDGNHTYEFAKRDFENSDRSLAPGGFIFFDDSADGSTWEVNKLTRELAQGDKYEVVLQNPNYLFRKK